jgi:hypothetical protein
LSPQGTSGISPAGAGFFVCKLKKLSNTKKEAASKDEYGQADPEDAAHGIHGVPDADGAAVEARSPAFSGKKRPDKRKGLLKHHASA